MKALIACEYSGTVRNAFAARGWDAWSCDLLPTESPGNHLQMDCFDAIGLHGPWDFIGMHPPLHGALCQREPPLRARHAQEPAPKGSRQVDGGPLGVGVRQRAMCLPRKLHWRSLADAGASADRPALAVWTRGNQGHLLVAAKPHRTKSDEYRGWPGSAHSPDATEQGPGETAEPDVHRHRRSDGRPMDPPHGHRPQRAEDDRNMKHYNASPQGEPRHGSET